MHYKVYKKNIVLVSCSLYALMPSLDIRLFMKSKKANWLALMP